MNIHKQTQKQQTQIDKFNSVRIIYFYLSHPRRMGKHKSKIVRFTDSLKKKTMGRDI